MSLWSKDSNQSGMFGALERRRKAKLYGVLFALGLITVGLSFLYSRAGGSGGAQENSLNLGARSPVNGELSFQIAKPVSLSALTIEQILDTRAAVVRAGGPLLRGRYVPQPEVWRGISKDAGWYSVKEYFLIEGGSSRATPEDRSVEARWILNPYLIVAPEIDAEALLGHNRAATIYKWAENISPNAVLGREDFSVYLRPDELFWNPKEGRGRVNFDLTRYVRELSTYLKDPISIDAIPIGLMTYNARDFGFTYLAVDQKESFNMQFPSGSTIPALNTNVLRAAPGLCNGRERCNRATELVDSLSGLKVSAVPARVLVKLWRSKPPDALNPAAVFEINFR